MRVVLDTNILVSACWKPEGLEAQVTNLARTGEITPCISAELLAEYRDVLSRKKLASVSTRATDLLAALEQTAIVVTPVDKVAASADDDDNRFLECAAAANADFLITGNLRHYPQMWENTRIVNARAFLSR